MTNLTVQAFINEPRLHAGINEIGDLINEGDSFGTFLHFLFQDDAVGHIPKRSVYACKGIVCVKDWRTGEFHTGALIIGPFQPNTDVFNIRRYDQAFGEVCEILLVQKEIIQFFAQEIIKRFVS